MSIYAGTATLTNCTVSGNSAATAAAALYNYSGTATLTNCTVSGNSAAAIGGGVLQLHRHGHADQLHRQRQLRQPRRRRGNNYRHGHADQLHRQRTTPPAAISAAAA